MSSSSSGGGAVRARSGSTPRTDDARGSPAADAVHSPRATGGTNRRLRARATCVSSCAMSASVAGSRSSRSAGSTTASPTATASAPCAAAKPVASSSRRTCTVSGSMPTSGRRKRRVEGASGVGGVVAGAERGIADAARSGNAVAVRCAAAGDGFSTATLGTPPISDGAVASRSVVAVPMLAGSVASAAGVSSSLTSAAGPALSGLAALAADGPSPELGSIRSRSRGAPANSVWLMLRGVGADASGATLRGIPARAPDSGGTALGECSGRAGAGGGLPTGR